MTPTLLARLRREDTLFSTVHIDDLARARAHVESTPGSCTVAAVRKRREGSDVGEAVGVSEGFPTIPEAFSSSPARCREVGSKPAVDNGASDPIDVGN